MSIEKIYKKYKILPSLAVHQYRVAAVSKLISENINKQVDTENIVLACLFHDMGNIIKFNLSLFPDFFEPEGVSYWMEVKDEFIKKYGKDEHLATLEITKDILKKNLVTDFNFSSKRVIELINAIGFGNAKNNYKSADYGVKIASYSDMRVEPRGVCSLESRLREGSKRFKINKPKNHDDKLFKTSSKYLKMIEDQIFKNCNIKPKEISDKSVEKYLFKN